MITVVDETLQGMGTYAVQGRLRKRLEDAGYRSLGSGSFGVVLQNPNDHTWVTKLFVPKDKYLRYVERLERKKFKNPHLPKVRNLTQIGYVNESGAFKPLAYSVEIEALEGISVGENMTREYVKHIWDFELTMVRISPFTVRDSEGYSYVPNPRHQELKFPLTHAEHRACMWIGHLSKKLFQEKNPVAFDIKHSNIMLRGQDFVITDPFC